MSRYPLEPDRLDREVDRELGLPDSVPLAKAADLTAGEVIAKAIELRAERMHPRLTPEQAVTEASFSDAVTRELYAEHHLFGDLDVPTWMSKRMEGRRIAKRQREEGR